MRYLTTVIFLLISITAFSQTRIGNVDTVAVSGDEIFLGAYKGTGDSILWAVFTPASLAAYIGSTITDSTRLVQDSILAYYQGGVEIGRDTISGVGGGSGGTAMYDSTRLSQDSILIHYLNGAIASRDTIRFDFNNLSNLTITGLTLSGLAASSEDSVLVVDGSGNVSFRSLATMAGFDSTRLSQDTILVHYLNGAIAGRDTIRHTITSLSNLTVNGLSLSNLSASTGDSVLVSDGNGNIGYKLASTIAGVIDSSRIVQDSILVHYQNGVEQGRDTIPFLRGFGDITASSVLLSLDDNFIYQHSGTPFKTELSNLKDLITNSNTTTFELVNQSYDLDTVLTDQGFTSLMQVNIFAKIRSTATENLIIKMPDGLAAEDIEVHVHAVDSSTTFDIILDDDLTNAMAYKGVIIDSLAMVDGQSLIIEEVRRGGLNVWSVVGEVDPSIDEDQYFASASAIASDSRDFAIGQRLYVASGAQYIVATDSIAGYVNDGGGVIELQNGEYALLQPRNGSFYVDFFAGATDNERVQNAFDYSIKSAQGPASIELAPRQYTFQNSVILGIPTGGDFDFVTGTVKGASAVYDFANNEGLTRVSTSTTDFPAFIIQRGREMRIENIYFFGGSNYLIGTDFAQMVNETDANWQTRGGRTNRYSPYAAIVIDPFDDQIAGGDQYPSLTEYYTHSTNGGTSGVTIANCSFDNWYIGVAVNPSDNVQNGDNIQLINSSVRRVYCLWASGQTQSRGNSINNVYSVGIVHTLVSSQLIGDGFGNPPYLSNLNIAGGTKYLFDVRSNLASNFYMNGIYAETLWSLGYTELNTHIIGSTFKFGLVDEYGIIGPNYHIQADDKVSIEGSQLIYFGDCGLKYPFSFIGNGTFEFRNCEFEGGLVAGNIHESSFDQSEGITFFNCTNRCISNSDFSSDDETDGLYYYERFNNQTFTQTQTNGALSFTSTVGHPFYIKGDNLFFGDGGPNSTYTKFMGVVETVGGVANETVNMVGAPESVASGLDRVYMLISKRALDRDFGDIELGNDTIKNVVNPSQWVVGDFVYSNSGALPNTARVIEVGADYLLLNTDATATTANDGIYFATRTKTSTGTVAPTSGTWFIGDYVTNTTTTSNIDRWVCITAGEFGSGDNEPEFEISYSGLETLPDDNLEDQFVPYKNVDEWGAMLVAPSFENINYYSRVTGNQGTYSLRLLNPSYTDPLVRVERSSDNATQDFSPLASGELDTTAIKAFVGANDGHVIIWYDQDDIRDAASPAVGNAPRIVIAGELVKEGGRVALDFDGVDDYLEMSASDINGLRTAIVVTKHVGSGQEAVLGKSTVNQEGLRTALFSSTYQNSSNDDFPDNGYFYVNKNLNSGSPQAHHVVFAVGDGGINIRSISQNAFNYQWTGTIQEVVLSNQDLSSEFIFIRNATAQYYSLFSPAVTGATLIGNTQLTPLYEGDSDSVLVADGDGFLRYRLANTLLSAVTPNLQSVTDVDSTTDNQITITNKLIVDSLKVASVKQDATTDSVLVADGLGNIRYRPASGLMSASTLQVVTDAGATTTNAITTGDLTVDGVIQSSSTSTDSKKMFLDGTNSVGTGTYMEITNPNGTRFLAGAEGTFYTGGAVTDVAFGNWSNGAMNFYTNATNRLSLSSTGNLDILSGTLTIGSVAQNDLEDQLLVLNNTTNLVQFRDVSTIDGTSEFANSSSNDADLDISGTWGTTSFVKHWTHTSTLTGGSGVDITLTLPAPSVFYNGKTIKVVGRNTNGVQDILVTAGANLIIDQGLTVTNAIVGNWETVIYTCTEDKTTSTYYWIADRPTETTGYEFLTDAQYTSGSPLVINQGDTAVLTINGLGAAVRDQLPIGVDSIFNRTTNKIMPIKEGDGYDIRISFQAESSAINGYGSLMLDISGTQGIIHNNVITFPRGANTEHPFSDGIPIFSGSEFITNGGEIKITSGDGNISLWGIKVLVKRDHIGHD